MEKKRKLRFSQKMENFCLAYIESGNASEAYRRSYDVSGMAEQTAAREAWNLLKRPQIEARIAELREVVMQRNDITVDTLLAELEEARALALETGRAAAAVTATMGKAKLLGLDKQIVELTGKNGAPIETKSQVTVDKRTLESVLDRL
jgi:phage terminase small subunit